MKVLSTVLKILAALAAVAGVVYVVATYGDKIVAWAKKMLDCCKSKCCEGKCCREEDEYCEAAEEAAEEAPAEAPAEEGAVHAEEADFEG